MRAIRILVNWLAVLTVPIWYPPLILVGLLTGNKESEVRSTVTGKKWFWE